MPEGPAGAPRPLAKGQLELHAAYSIPQESGQKLEDSSYRENIEDNISDSLENRNLETQIGRETMHINEIEITLEPAGTILNIRIAFGENEISSGTEDEILSMLDRLTYNLVHTNAVRPPQGFPKYSWVAK